MKKIRLIYNSKAGQSKFEPFLDRTIGKFCDAGFELEIFRVSEGHDVDNFVKNTPSDTYALVVAGGDGTINRVVNIMMKNNIKVPLGIIPAGTSNDFAHHLKLSNDFYECVDNIINGNLEKIDVAKVNDQYFINILVAGFLAATSYKTDKKLKSVLGQAAYYMTAVNESLKYAPFVAKIETPDAILEEKIMVFAVFNGSSIGRIDKFTHESSVQDGKLDIVFVRDCKITDVLRIAGELEDRSYMQDQNVIYLRESKFKISIISGSCDRPDTDGDVGPEFPLDIECIPGGIQIYM